MIQYKARLKTKMRIPILKNESLNIGRFFNPFETKKYHYVLIVVVIISSLMN